jgi:molybdopterin biosynthesis enzyme
MGTDTRILLRNTMSASMMPADVAEALVLDWVQSLDSERDRETVPLTDALGRVLAAAVPSPLDFPHWDNSAMDGYAVRYADVQGAAADHPVTLTVVEEIPAGKIPQSSDSAGAGGPDSNRIDGANRGRHHRHAGKYSAPGRWS